MLEKGALEDLSPYVEESGIREEDYFPFTFNLWREEGRIYGICPRFSGGEGAEIAEEVLGGRKPDIRTLVDALLSWQEEAVYMKNYGPQKLLEVFLGGTETLWGSVDWEQGTCDFSGELFRNILELAKRYGDDGRGGRFPSLAQDLGRNYSDIFYFHGPKEQEEREMVTLGVLFDDGCHMAFFPFSALAVNANSAHKEGAWEFICFLLEEEAQNTYAAQGNMPALKSAFDLLMDGLLPEDILWREKAAFSDAVGHSMVDYLKEYADGLYTQAELENGSQAYAHARPFTKESLLYRELFEKYYPGQGRLIDGFWMPNPDWEGCRVDDPSARVLPNYGASGE